MYKITYLQMREMKNYQFYILQIYVCHHISYTDKQMQ